MMNNQILMVSSLNKISPGNYLIDAFEKIGFEVIVISDVAHPRAEINKFGAVDIKKFIESKKITPKLLLFVEGGEMGVFPTNFAELSFPKFWWGIDTHLDYEKHLNISRIFDHSFIAQKEYVQLLKVDGIKSVSWLPLAFPINSLPSAKREIDISCIGSFNPQRYPERSRLVQKLRNLTKSHFFDSCDPNEMFLVYTKSKIVFNQSIKNDINMRVFEAMGSGALLVTNNISNNGLEDLFEIGKDLIVYKTPEELISNVVKYLQDPILRTEIATRGQSKILKNHTYENRAMEILSQAPLVSSNQNCQNYELPALFSLGLYSDSIRIFWRILLKKSRGKRNRLIVCSIAIFFYISFYISKIIELIVYRFRRSRW